MPPRNLRHTGSSPRMRGTRHGRGVDAALPGIIPAYAGNTATTRTMQSETRDHPRVCGEHLSDVPVVYRPTGSSPRMRGTRQASRSPWSQTGIIPAHAGNTDRTRSMCFEYRDHPRVCGEHSRMRSSRKHITGSSPRMRGNTQHFNQFHVLVEDHPRVCGEHPASAAKLWLRRGSSPRMRGTRLVELRRSHIRGIIPAYAGNTL